MWLNSVPVWDTYTWYASNVHSIFYCGPSNFNLSCSTLTFQHPHLILRFPPYLLSPPACLHPLWSIHSTVYIMRPLSTNLMYIVAIYTQVCALLSSTRMYVVEVKQKGSTEINGPVSTYQGVGKIYVRMPPMHTCWHTLWHVYIYEDTLQSQVLIHIGLLALVFLFQYHSTTCYQTQIAKMHRNIDLLTKKKFSIIIIFFSRTCTYMFFSDYS